MGNAAIILASSVLPALVGAGSLLAGRVPASGDEWVSEDRLRSLLPKDLGPGGFEPEQSADNSKLARVEKALQPLFVALPKDQYGRLGRNTVRFALSRYFARSVKGLEVGSEPWNPSSALITQGQAAAYLLHRVEESIGGAAFGLRELSLLAIAIEQLQVLEMGDLFDAALEVSAPANAGNLSHSDAETVLGNYMMAFVLGRKPGELASMGQPEIEKMHRGMNEVFPPWEQAFELARSTLSGILSGDTSVSRAEMAQVAAEAARRFEGTFQETSCRDLKSALMKHEDGSSGRVALPNFYQAGASGSQWHFQENRDYLRALAALDESDKKMARVVVSNYMTSEPNCIADTGSSSLCCRNECDSLFQTLEETIAAPEVEPSHLLGLVETLSSSTVVAPRKLSTSMKQRLESVAKRHGGAVPLHGRLFGQWMHHVFPRECPYPRVPSTGASTEKARNNAAGATLAATEAAAMGVGGSAQLGEELRGARHSAPTQATSLRKELCRTVVLLIALFAVVVGLWRTMWTALLNSGLVDESHAGPIAPAQRAAAAAAAGTATPVPTKKEHWLKAE